MTSAGCQGYNGPFNPSCFGQLPLNEVDTRGARHALYLEEEEKEVEEGVEEKEEEEGGGGRGRGGRYSTNSHKSQNTVFILLIRGPKNKYLYSNP